MDNEELKAAWQKGELRVVPLEEAQAMCAAWWAQYGVEWSEVVAKLAEENKS